MAEALHLVGMLRHPFEGAELGIERPLEGSIITGCDVLIFSVLEERRKRLVDLIETIESIIYNQRMPTLMSSSTANSKHLHVGDGFGQVDIGEERGDMIGDKFILAGFLDHAKRRESTQDMAQ